MIVTDAEGKDILDKLDEKYKHNYSDWLKVTTALKGIDRFDLWDEYSKQSPHYNYNKNLAMWNCNKGVIDINYLVWLVKQQGHDIDYIPKYKPYNPITKDISTIKQINMNKYMCIMKETWHQQTTTTTSRTTKQASSRVVQAQVKQQLKPNTWRRT